MRGEAVAAAVVGALVGAFLAFASPCASVADQPLGGVSCAFEIAGL